MIILIFPKQFGNARRCAMTLPCLYFVKSPSAVVLAGSWVAIQMSIVLLQTVSFLFPVNENIA